MKNLEEKSRGDGTVIAAPLLPYHLGIIRISTCLFRRRSASVSFVVIGRDSPKPIVFILDSSRALWTTI